MLVVFDKNYQTCVWEIVGELQQSSHDTSCLVSQPRLREDFQKNYYTSIIITRQQLFCNLLVIFQLATSGIRSLCLTLGGPVLALVFGFTTVPQWSPSGVYFFHFIDEFYTNHEFTTTTHFNNPQHRKVIWSRW